MSRGLDDADTALQSSALEMSDAASPSGSPSDERRYVLVVDSQGSRRVRLPDGPKAKAAIGRAHDADVRLHDEAASRRHATLELDGASAILTDLGSQNGTRVGGEKVEGARVLRSGDVITIGTSTLVFQARQTQTTTQSALELGELLRRGEQELERAMRFQRPITVVALRIPSSPAQRTGIEIALARSIRSIDVFSWSSPDEVLLLMPELSADDAFDVTGRILRDVSLLVPRGARGGFSTGPTDADEISGLIELARAGTLTSTTSAGDIVSSTFRSLVLGGRTIVVADAAMLGIYRMAERLAASDLPVLVNGETGTGKELVANAIHAWSARKAGPFVAVNCASFTETLAESELFGHEKGAFTGAVSARQGVFERAQGGTVFLDEVGELSPSTQASLLRVLETRRVQRVGGGREIPVDFRLVSATNRDVAREATTGSFRQDLYYRLGAAVIRLPPLRERSRELPVLAQALLETACRENVRPPKVLSRAATDLCARYGWPGNVRELKHAMEYLAATIDDSVIDPVHLEPILDQSRIASAASSIPEAITPSDAQAAFKPLYDELAELEKERIASALEATGGNQTRAAALLAIPLRTFQAKVKQYQLLSGGARDERGPKKK